MGSRKITRVAMLQDYTGRPENLLPLVDEAAEKGYGAVCLSARQPHMDVFRALCEKADSLGLQVEAFTGYMKYQHKYLSEHPDQRMVLASEHVDQDNLSAQSWGCPFNPDFKERYFRLLREIACCPGIAAIMVNDEASLASGCYCRKCREDYAREIGGEMPLRVAPEEEDWQDESWRRYLKWKIDRWNDVHGEMARVIHEVNPNVKAAFQASPASDLWTNPWSTCVDLAGMVEQLDGLSTDPYYTFHRRLFDPAEVYLSEWSRFLAGIVPEGKQAEIIPQGFSHPTFTRPLGEQDGYWSAIVPPACGIDVITPYTYTLQGCSPVQQAYERCFEFDRHFERTRPLKYAAVLHSVKTEMYLRPLPVETPGSYDGTRVLPVSESLRHKGVPYGYLPDSALSDTEALHAFRVVVLPEVNCLSEQEEAGLKRFIEDGGSAVILGQLGIADEIGRRRGRSLLAELWGVTVLSESDRTRTIKPAEGVAATQGLQLVDEEIAGRLSGGIQQPLWTLSHCVEADVPPDAELVAEFADEAGRPTGEPAIVSLPGRGRVLWFAGFPSRVTTNPIYGTAVQNVAHQLFALLVQQAAGEKAALRVEDWPPEVPMKRLRPVDGRYMCTFEFFPLAGEDCFIGVVTSYFREPASFPMVLDVPAGKHLKSVVELVENRDVPYETADGAARITVQTRFDTPALVFLFELE